MDKLNKYAAIMTSYVIMSTIWLYMIAPEYLIAGVFSCLCTYCFISAHENFKEKIFIVEKRQGIITTGTFKRKKLFTSIVWMLIGLLCALICAIYSP